MILFELIGWIYQFVHRIGKRVAKSNEERPAAQIMIRSIAAHRIPFVVMRWPPFFEYRMGKIRIILVAFHRKNVASEFGMLGCLALSDRNCVFVYLFFGAGCTQHSDNKRHVRALEGASRILNEGLHVVRIVAVVFGVKLIIKALKPDEARDLVALAGS